MEIVGREALAMVLQLPAGRADRLALDVHLGFARRPPALFEIARRAGGRDILPAGPPALGTRHDMVEGQFPVTAAIDAAETVAEEQVEPGEGRIFVGPDELAQGDHRRQLHRGRRAVHLPVIMGDDVDAFEEHRLDRGLPWPQRQRIVAERRIVGVEHQRWTGVRMAEEVGMIHGAIVSSVRPAFERRASGLVALSRRLPGAGPWRETGGQKPVFPSATPDANPG